MAFDIKAWSDYGVAIVGGAGALAGLLFVAFEAHRGRAGQALVLFVVPLVLRSGQVSGSGSRLRLADDCGHSAKPVPLKAPTWSGHLFAPRCTAAVWCASALNSSRLA